MYFEKHVCNSRTTEPERSLWRPATSKSPQRCKVASPPSPCALPSLHLARSSHRAIAAPLLRSSHLARVPPPFKMYPARSGRRWSTATVDVHAAEAARTRRRSVQEGLSKRGGHSGVARSRETASRRAPCATPHDGRLAADVRYKINSTGHIQVRHESMLTSATTKIHAVHASMRASLLCDKAATSSRATRRSTCASHAKFPFFSHKWSRNGCDRALT